MRRRVARQESPGARQLAAIGTPEARALLTMLRRYGDDPEVAELFVILATDQT